MSDPQLAGSQNRNATGPVVIKTPALWRRPTGTPTVLQEADTGFAWVRPCPNVDPGESSPLPPGAVRPNRAGSSTRWMLQK